MVIENGAVAPASAAGETSGEEPVASNGDKPVDLRPQPQASKPTRILPTNRIAFPKQLEILRAFEAASGPSRKPVPLTEVATLTKLAAQTLSLPNPFFLDVGLIRRGEGGGFVPSDAVHEYALQYQWNPVTAASKLAPVFEEGWAWGALRARLQLSGSLLERDAIGILVSACNATPD